MATDPTLGPIFQRARAGDRDAVRALLRWCSSWLWPLLWRGTGGHRQDAEDALQEVMLRALRGGSHFDPERPLQPWLRTIAMRVVADHHRQRGEMLEAAESVDEIEPIEDLAQAERSCRLDRALRELDPTTRALLRLRYADDLGREELARIAGLSVEAVKKRLQRGRATLRALLREHQENLP